jgi:hypothetical protein
MLWAKEMTTMKTMEMMMTAMMAKEGKLQED